MINRYYQLELSHLRELAVEFSQAHPALAPMLSGTTQDPDVERLLEGTAFLTGQVRQKLDDEFPEVVHGLMRLIFPHYLRPIPASTTIVFKPKASLKESIRIPAGTALASVPVEGTKCPFRTCYDVELHPLKITGAAMRQQPGQPATITLNFEMTGFPLSAWKADSLRLHIGGGYADAANLYYLFFQHVRSVTLSPSEGGSSIILPPQAIRPVGMANDEGLFPYPPQSFPGYRIIQEYFILPEKFLYIDITGLEAWQDRGPGTGFKLVFELRQPPSSISQVKQEQFVLFATPAVNLFPFDGDPISLDHRQPEYRVVPSGGDPTHHQVYSVERVIGLAPGTVQKRAYAPFELFTPQDQAVPVYFVNAKPSATRPDAELFISVAYPPQAGAPTPETLSIQLMCTNALLPERLKVGDINQPTSTSPELAEFTNIRQPTATVQPPLGRNLLWRFLSHLSLNLLSLADSDNLKALLRLYIFPEGRDRAAILANEKRVEGISSLEIHTVNRLVNGLIMRGQEIHLGLSPDNFASRGDMFLFGSIMDHFLGTYASINCFTRLKVKDALSGDIYEWPVRVGDRPLI
ncbi:MAG: type VI secretion system baseplate subunit TssF [Proteobacteria bacterium]|nr:type VI secretion system baseplate subunit TssF [Pseudomonadota bacterium]